MSSNDYDHMTFYAGDIDFETSNLTGNIEEKICLTECPIENNQKCCILSNALTCKQCSLYHNNKNNKEYRRKGQI